MTNETLEKAKQLEADINKLTMIVNELTYLVEHKTACLNIENRLGTTITLRYIDCEEALELLLNTHKEQLKFLKERFNNL